MMNPHNSDRLEDSLLGTQSSNTNTLELGNKNLIIQNDTISVPTSQNVGKEILESTERENQAQYQHESSSDANVSTCDIPPDTSKVSYEREAPQNQAQNNPSVDIIDTGHIIPISSKHSSDNNMTITANEDKIQKQNIENIYRIGHTDIFACKNCKNRGDRFFMLVHACSGAP